MKATTAGSLLRGTVLVLTTSLLTTSISAAVISSPSPALMSMVMSNNVASVTVTDPNNHVWILQGSTDLKSWTQIATWKVYNGNFHGQFPIATSNAYYRSFYDPTRDTVLSTVETALHLPITLANYANPTLPSNFLQPPIVTQDNTPSTNMATDAGATLGRALFYDKRLSANQTVSCSSCHQAKYGFSDPRPFSTGFNGGSTARNAMGLTQARYYPRGHFFWDERANTLEDQVLMPIQNSVEMGMTLDALTNRLNAEPFYTSLFNQAFGTTDITSDRISRALAQFVRSIISTHSKYDVGLTIGFTNFTAQENLGRDIFFGHVGTATCAACHGTDNFVPNNVFNNGLEYPYVDKGIGGISGQQQDMGVFKVPSLRNIELTAPYMHDGRFATLEDVVEFYNSGVVANPNLAPPLRAPPAPGTPPGSPRRLNLTTDQKAALVAFLKTLTDRSVTTDPKFSDPFNYGN